MNDQRITAYSLNELHGADREKFEADMATDPFLQRDLLAACEITDALGEVSGEPVEVLEPQARARLLREIVANQETFRARRKIIRLAVPASLAAAASIAVLLWVTGGETTQEPAMAAAAAGERVFVRAESSAIASGVATKGEQNTNTMVPQKRVMPWDAKVLGADADPVR